MKTSLRIYIGCALKHAPQVYKDEIFALKQQLATLPFVEILEFVTNPHSTPTKVYHNDIIHCVMNCDLMVADFSYPSLGLGYEVATMLEVRKKPVLGFAHTNAIVSSLILGIPHANFTFSRYERMLDIAPIIQRAIER